jgi:hypothetical protein
MKRIGKFVVIGVGGLLAIIVLGMLFIAIFDVKQNEIKGVDLIDGWMWYRIIFYALVIAAWTPICRLMTRPRFNLSELSEEEMEKYTQKRERDVQYMKLQLWKVALLLMFFELVIIQQLWI